MGSDLEASVNAIEKEIYTSLESEKKVNGPAEIRTQDLRRVKATS